MKTNTALEFVIVWNIFNYSALKSNLFQTHTDFYVNMCVCVCLCAIMDLGQFP